MANVEKVQSGGAVRCLLAPLQLASIMVPNAAVSEIVGYVAPTIRSGAPAWYLGEVPWRGVNLPLVMIEGMLGQGEFKDSGRGQIMVIPALNKTPGLRFLGVLCQGIPKLVMADATTVNPVGQGVTSPIVASLVTVESKQAIIPDLGLIEKMIARVAA